MRSSKKSKRHSEIQSSPYRAFAILIPLTVIALSPVLVAGFIRLDDYNHILDNPHLQSLSISNLFAFWTKSYFGLYVPVTYSIWWAFSGIVRLFGTLRQSASLFHALNLAIHVVNASLVFLLVKTLLGIASTTSPTLAARGGSRTEPFGADSGRMQGAAKRRILEVFKRAATQQTAQNLPERRRGDFHHGLLSQAQTRGISLLSALFFALHPAQVETVAWISEFKGVLAGMFGLLGIWHYYRSPRKILTAVYLVAAVLSKPSAIVFPGVLLLVDRILLGKSMKESAKAPILFWTLLLPLVLITKRLQPDLNMEFIPNFLERLRVASDAFAFYFCKLLFPFHLALDYGRSPRYVLHEVPGWQMALSLLLVVAGAATVAYSLRRPGPSQRNGGPAWHSFVACGWAIFCLSIAPVLGLVPFEFQDFSTVADHYLYVPMLGASLAVVGLLIRSRATTRTLGISAAILIALALSTFSQARIWRSTQTLFAHTLDINPRSYLGHYSIATELFEARRTDEGIEQTLKCLEINPDYLSAEVALGVAWIQKGKFQNAIDYYLSVLAKNPNFAGKRAPLVASIHNNLGMALHQVGRDAEGTEHFKQAVQVDPKSINGHTNLGHAAFNEGRFSDAVTHYQAALALSPGDPALRQRLEIARQRLR